MGNSNARWKCLFHPHQTLPVLWQKVKIKEEKITRDTQPKEIKMAYTLGEHNLTISYDIPESGMYEHDILAKKLAGEEAVETGWGSVMFCWRHISYKFHNKESRDAAHQRFTECETFMIL